MNLQAGHRLNMPSRFFLLLAVFFTLVIVGCRGSGADPSGAATIPVVEPTMSPISCRDDGYPSDAPRFDGVNSSSQREQNGVQVVDIAVGDGEVVSSDVGVVSVRYSGWLSDGCLFDSSYLRGETPEPFQLAGLIPGFAIGVDGMRGGGRRRIVIPSELGYGAVGLPPGIPPNAELHFDVEIVSIGAPMTIANCRNDEYPSDAPLFDGVDSSSQREQNGVRVVDIAVGEGESVASGDVVSVRYSGWFSDGCLFDSSYLTNEEPVQFQLASLIPGFAIGVDGMRAGGRRRIIIPFELGYGAAGAPPVVPPNAELHFDVELVGIGAPMPAINE